MVADIADGSAFDKHGKPFRRRRLVPGISLLVALAAGSGLIWAVALNREPEVAQLAVCNTPPPPADAALGTQLDAATMTEVPPAGVADTTIRVLNASGQGGQAADVAASLSDIGFAQPTAENDPLFAATQLACQGQLRFGPAGRAAAAAVWLVTPCVELFEDERPDPGVDLAVGTDFPGLAAGDDVSAALASVAPGVTTGPDMAAVERVHARIC